MSKMQERESRILVKIQKTLLPISSLPVIARGMSHFGEHAMGWLGIAAVGAITDKKRRSQWKSMGVAVFSAHAISVIVKNIVRRRRPNNPDIVVGVSTPSSLSFPSSHATSTTAALVALAKIQKSPLPLVGVPLMALSRLILGVHYPTDVTVGSLMGATTAAFLVKDAGEEKK